MLSPCFWPCLGSFVFKHSLSRTYLATTINARNKYYISTNDNATSTRPVMPILL